jgi:hypothetical protein
LKHGKALDDKYGVHPLDETAQGRNQGHCNSRRQKRRIWTRNPAIGLLLLQISNLRRRTRMRSFAPGTVVSFRELVDMNR